MLKAGEESWPEARVGKKSCEENWRQNLACTLSFTFSLSEVTPACGGMKC